MNHVANEPKLPARPALYLRLSKEEYIRAANDAAVTGRKIQDLVKEAYFKSRKSVSVLMTNEDYVKLMTALSKIGTNINQVAKHLNSGGRRPDNSVFEFLQNEILQLSVFFSSKYCRCPKAIRAS